MPTPRTRVGILMPDASFDRVFTREDVARLSGHPAIELLSERPLDDQRTADRELLADAELLVTGWGTQLLTGALLDAMPVLRAIAHSAGTVRFLLEPSVYDRGIAVCSAARTNAIPVAEFAVAQITLAAKQAFWSAQAMREGSRRPSPEEVWPRVGLHGTTVGVVAASTIGRMVLERLRDADVRILLADPTITSDDAAALGAEHVPLDELMRRSDIISLHAPDLPSTHHMVGPQQIRAMAPGATLINTARGALVDHDALTARLQEHADIFAILDVTTPEPLPVDSPLRTHPNTFITPHIAGSIGAEVHRLSAHAVDEVISFATTGSFHRSISATEFALNA